MWDVGNWINDHNRGDKNSTLKVHSSSQILCRLWELLCGGKICRSLPALNWGSVWLADDDYEAVICNPTPHNEHSTASATFDRYKVTDNMLSRGYCPVLCCALHCVSVKRGDFNCRSPSTALFAVVRVVMLSSADGIRSHPAVYSRKRQQHQSTITITINAVHWIPMKYNVAHRMQFEEDER